MNTAINGFLARVSFAFAGLTNTDLIALVRNVITLMTGNVQYPSEGYAPQLLACRRIALAKCAGASAQLSWRTCVPRRRRNGNHSRSGSGAACRWRAAPDAAD